MRSAVRYILKFPYEGISKVMVLRALICQEIRELGIARIHIKLFLDAGSNHEGIRRPFAQLHRGLPWQFEVRLTYRGPWSTLARGTPMEYLPKHFSSENF
jgi:hypothetical protein